MRLSQAALHCAASLLGRALLSPLRLLPIERDRALFVSYRGKQYSCNPRAISEELLRQGGVKITWAFHQPEKFAYLREQGVEVLSDHSVKFILRAMTARVIVTNTYYKPFLPRRRKQFYLRTWHGGGAYKRVTYPKGLMGLHIRLQQQGASLYLSSSEAFTRMTLREAFGYRGEVLETGMPRNDLLLDAVRRAETAERLRAEMGLKGRLALFAPTYREDRPAPEPDLSCVKAALEARFGGEWTVLSRSHHVYNADDADMQELLCLADALITDYSSSIWDMSLTGKPVFLYAPDLAEYRAERDFFTDIHSWGFPLAETEEELAQIIRGFDEEAYQKSIRAHHQALGCRETGHAAKDAANVIRRVTEMN